MPVTHMAGLLWNGWPRQHRARNPVSDIHSIDDREYARALIDISKHALDVMGSPKDAVDALTDAIAMVAAEAGFTVSGTDDRIALTWEEFSPTNPLPPSAGLH